MTRKEAVVLVSRALSLLWGGCAVDDVTYLPERLHSFLHYANRDAELGFPGSDSYLAGSYRLEVGMLFLRIAFYLTLAVVFWKCGPWVERTLLPAMVESEPTV